MYLMVVQATQRRRRQVPMEPMVMRAIWYGFAWNWSGLEVDSASAVVEVADGEGWVDVVVVRVVDGGWPVGRERLDRRRESWT